jgi:hypothetical protein
MMEKEFMSRSFRKNPIIGIGASSDKEYKRLANRKLRRLTHESLRCSDLENEIFPVQREVSDVWGMAKDGKRRFDPADPENAKDLRK